MILKNKKIYLIGIKGVGMTALAQFFKAAGARVSGSDVPETFMTDKVLKALKIPVYAPFAAANLPADADFIVYSIAYSRQNNPEMARLAEQPTKAKLLSYSEALGLIFNSGRGLAVCGSHGKTTTSAWLGYVLWKAGKKPNVLVGSNVPQFKGSSLSGNSKLFVAEADEYGNKLRYLDPQGIILNNIDYDHPDFFPTEKDYVQVFRSFIKRLPANGFLIINNRDAFSRQLRRSCPGRVASYDVADENYDGTTVNYLIHDLRLKNGCQYFQVNDWGEFKIRLWGRHNVFNAAAVIAAARELKVGWPAIRKHLAGFTGTERRTQILGRYKGALIIDDYAHHPTEIRATLAGIREHYPQRRLRVVFHPHTFTRTKALFADFAQSFNLADELVILDIYGSAREKQGGVSSAQLVRAVQAENKRRKKIQDVKNISDIEAAVAYLRQKSASDEIILLMGAGDVFRVGEELLWPNKKRPIEQKR